MQGLQQKIEGLSSSREEMERRTLRLRDALADVVAKVDNISLDVKDAQGQVKLQNKMLDNQGALQKQRGEDGTKMSDAQRLALDGKWVCGLFGGMARALIIVSIIINW